MKLFGCKRCGEKNPQNFYGDQKIVCKKCRNIEQGERSRKRKKEEVKYFGGKCVICGYDKYIGALQFHHLDPNQKDPNFIQMKNWSLMRKVSELEKCILVCANCNSEIHGKITDCVSG